MLALLSRVPFLTAGEVGFSAATNDGGVDAVVQVTDSEGRPQALVVEVKTNPRPSLLRMALLRIQHTLRVWPSDDPAYGVVIAPALSERARALCKEHGVGYLDFAGNAFLCFDHIFIETEGSKDRQPSPKRVFKALFGTRSTRLLRLILQQPERAWMVEELAGEAGVSVGLVSNVRRALIEEQWATAAADGLRLTDPDGLLDAWSSAYTKPVVHRDTFHTVLHGPALKDAIAVAFEDSGSGSHLLLSGNSAAQWLAPYASGGPTCFYADDDGLSALIRHLRLKRTDRGPNVIVEHPKDEGLFLDRITPAPLVWCTGPVQTYLDLQASGERNVEAAAHLRREVLAPLWETLTRKPAP